MKYLNNEFLEGKNEHAKSDWQKWWLTFEKKNKMEYVKSTVIEVLIQSVG